MEEAPVFPLKVVWADGSVDMLHSRAEIETDLEDFDSSDELYGVVSDALGRTVDVKVSMTWMERLAVARA